MRLIYRMSWLLLSKRIAYRDLYYELIYRMSYMFRPFVVRWISHVVLFLSYDHLSWVGIMPYLRSIISVSCIRCHMHDIAWLILRGKNRMSYWPHFVVHLFCRMVDLTYVYRTQIACRIRYAQSWCVHRKKYTRDIHDIAKANFTAYRK